MKSGAGSVAWMPWADTDVLWLCVTSTIGIVAITTSWYGISGSASTGTQALWLNIGVSGAVIAALGNCVWLLRGRRAVGQRRAGLVSLAPVTPSGALGMPMEDTVTMPLGWVRVEGTRKVHRVDCPLMSGKAVELAGPGDGDPCGVCVP